MQSIQKVLSKVVEEHQKALGAYILQEIDLDFAPFSKLSNNYGNCLNLVNLINEAIKKNNLIIQNKIDDPYTPCSNVESNLSNWCEDIKNVMRS